MGKPLMLKESDIQRIDRLKARLDAPTKVDVVRTALGLLERDTDRAERVARAQHRRSAGIMQSSSALQTSALFELRRVV